MYTHVVQRGNQMKIYSIINQKGGVGKSTTALSIGSGLYLDGKRVLFIDLDAQGNLTYSINNDQSEQNAMNVLMEPSSIKQEICHTELGDIIPSSPLLATADTNITQTGKEYRLKEAIALVKDDYDYVIIDTPPALSILTVNALTACDGVIIPAQSDIFSLQGIGQLNSTIQTVKKYCNPSLTIIGIILTRFNSRSIITREVAALINQTAEQLGTKVFSTKIRECSAIKEAQAVKQSIFTYAPKSNASADYKLIIDELLKGE